MNPNLSASLFTFGLKLSDEVKVNLSLLVFLLGISIYALEIYLKKDVKTSSEKTAIEIKKAKATEMGIPYDSRTKLEVLRDLRKEGFEAYPNVNAGDLIKHSSTLNGLSIKGNNILPLGGISNKVVIASNENGYWMKYKSDKFGFNNPNEVYQNIKIDIVMIGDSYTEGYAVKNKETIGAVLREFNFNVINLGKAGHGPLLEFATLKEYAKPLKPKILLWLYNVTDIQDLHKELHSPILKKYLNEDKFSQNLRLNQNEIDTVWINYVSKKLQKSKDSKIFTNYWVKKILKISLLSNLRSKFKLKPIASLIEPATDKDYIIFQDILKKSNDMVTGWNGQLYFVYLPSYHCDCRFYNEKKCREIKVKEALKDCTNK